MPTMYTRLLHYCTLKKIPLPNRDQKAEIGKQIAHIYISEKKPETKVSRVESVEPDGTYTAISYPKTFIPVIDQFIEDYMTQLIDKQPIIEKPQTVEKRQRKRIPVNRPAYPKKP